MQLLAVCCVVGASAYNEGDYIYSNTAKYKATSGNLVTNGAFADNQTGWTSEAGADLNGEAWGIEAAQGPKGENVLQSLNGSVEGDGVGVFRAWTGLTGIYTISYWVKGAESVVSSVTAGTANYIDFYVNATGAADKTDARQVAETVSIGAEWTQVVDTVEMHTGDYLVFNAAKLTSGTLLTNFEINQVVEVYDTRIVDRLINYAEKLMAEPDLQNGKDEFAGIVDMLKYAIADPNQNESKEAMEGLIEQFNEFFDSYMNENGGNTNSGDWSTHGYSNWNNINNNTVVGSWKTYGDRWGFSPNSGQLERPEGDGYVLTAGIQRGQNQSGTVRGVYVERTDLDPGKYFIAIEAQAVNAATTGGAANNWLYGSDHTTRVWEGPSMFVGTDTLVMRPATEEELELANPNYTYTEVADTLNGYYWKKYYMIGEIKEGQTVRAGFLFPPYYSGGFRISLRNPEFRMIGKTERQLNWEAAVKNVITQQNELKNRIDNYPTDIAEYAWEKDSLARAIANAQPVLESSLAQVDAEGNSTVAVTDEGIEELKALYQTLLDQVNAMGRAKNWVVNTNAIQDNLRAAIADGQASLDNEKSAGAPADLRTALQTAVSEGQALIDGISSTTQTDEFTAAIEKIGTAKTSFDMSAATFDNPAPLALVNQFFEDNGKATSKTKYTSNFNGWNVYVNTSASGKDFGTSAREGVQGWAIQMWRGDTVSPEGKCWQTATVAPEGVYTLFVKGYATNDKMGKLMSVGQEILNEEGIAVDTIFKPNVRLFMGLEGAPDSITISKNYKWGSDGTYHASPYVLMFVKKDNNEAVIELGGEAVENADNAGANSWGFGDCRLYYCGNEAKFNADVKAAFDAAVSKANSVVAANADDERVAYLIVKMKRYLNDAASAATAKEQLNIKVTIEEIEEMIADLTGLTAVKPIAVEMPEGLKEGIYTINGVKVGDKADGLKPGLYIINGKKYIVK